MYFITFYFYIISELQFYIIFNILLDNEVMETSKRRSFLPLIFIIKFYLFAAENLYEKKNAVYYFQISLFVPEIFKFLKYAN